MFDPFGRTSHAHKNIAFYSILDIIILRFTKKARRATQCLPHSEPFNKHRCIYIFITFLFDHVTTRYSTASWNPSSWQTKTGLFYIYKIMSADRLFRRWDVSSQCVDLIKPGPLFSKRWDVLPQDSGLNVSNRLKIWRALRQHNCLSNARAIRSL